MKVVCSVPADLALEQKNNNKRLGVCNSSHYALSCAEQMIAEGRDVC